MVTATPVDKKTRNIVLEEFGVKQPVLVLPPWFVRLDPNANMVEFTERSPKVLEARLVPANTPARSKRYQIVHHRGSAKVSLPLPWLRNLSAKPGDLVVVTGLSASGATWLQLEFQRLAR